MTQSIYTYRRQSPRLAPLEFEVRGFDEDDELEFIVETHWAMDEGALFFLPREEVIKLHEALGRELGL